MVQEIKEVIHRIPYDSVLTVRGVAHLLNIHVNTVRRWSDIGILKSYRIGPRGDRRFRRDDILVLLQPEDESTSSLSLQ
jgi:excisionase family DNA binding protein